MVTWIDALSRTRNHIVKALRRAFSPSNEAAESLDDLERTLLEADMPVRLVQTLIEDMGKAYRGLSVSRAQMLRQTLIKALDSSGHFAWDSPNKPFTILVVGVNGSGKTTTCAKLAFQARQRGLDTLLGATDTYRAAGADQLKWWADALGCDVVSGAPGADAAAVAYDAWGAAVARKKDILIVDTAGRMHTRRPLMQELQKVRGALSKQDSRAPNEIWVVLDATLGQNAIVQARVFHEAVPLTGAIIAKLDGSSKAGFGFSIMKELGIPIRFVGLGEGREDLVEFDPEKYVDGLLGLDVELEGPGHE